MDFILWRVTNAYFGKKGIHMIIGTIASVGDGAASVIIDSEDTATKKMYKSINSYSPKVGDRVLLDRIGGSYVIIGSITGK